jgi:hypothetical protein
MTDQPSTGVAAKCFRDLFCESASCCPDEFEQRLFWLCLHPKGRGAARIMWTVDREGFRDDFALVRAVAKTSSYADFRSEMSSFRRERPVRGFFRETLLARVSGRSLLTVASKLFGAYNTGDDTDPKMDTSFLLKPGAPK